jgi:hypothetical protein
MNRHRISESPAFAYRSKDLISSTIQLADARLTGTPASTVVHGLDGNVFHFHADAAAGTGFGVVLAGERVGEIECGRTAGEGDGIVFTGGNDLPLLFVVLHCDHHGAISGERPAGARGELAWRGIRSSAWTTIRGSGATEYQIFLNFS